MSGGMGTLHIWIYGENAYIMACFSKGICEPIISVMLIRRRF